MSLRIGRGGTGGGGVSDEVDENEPMLGLPRGRRRVRGAGGGHSQLSRKGSVNILEVALLVVLLRDEFESREFGLAPKAS